MKVPRWHKAPGHGWVLQSALVDGMASRGKGQGRHDATPLLERALVKEACQLLVELNNVVAMGVRGLHASKRCTHTLGPNTKLLTKMTSAAQIFALNSSSKKSPDKR